MADALTEAGMQVEKSEVIMGDGAIRTVGEFEIDLHFHADVDAKVKLVIEGEEV